MRAEDKLRMEMFLKAKEEQKKRDLDRINRLLQGAHMAISVSSSIFEEAEDILERNQLVLDNAITEKQKAYIDTADAYFKCFAEMIKTDIEKQNYWRNLQEVEKKFRKWVGLNNAETADWHKVSKELPRVGEKVIVVTRNGKYALSEIDDSREWKGSGTFKDSIIAWRPIDKYEEEDEEVR